MNRRSGGNGGDVIRMVMDDETVARLREAADERGIEVEQLMIHLLVASSTRIDELLGRPGAGAGGRSDSARFFRHDPLAGA